jgi:hypothetical protein
MLAVSVLVTAVSGCSKSAETCKARAGDGICVESGNGASAKPEHQD